MKTCSSCGYRVKGICKRSKLCNKYINDSYSCIHCKFVIQCKKLGKKVNNSCLCFNFKKSKVKLPSDIEFDEEQSQLFSPARIVEKVIATDYNSDLIDLVDESDIPKPRNLVEAIAGKRFLNFKPYPKQLRDYIFITSSYCPYCSDINFLKNIAKDEKLGNIVDRVKLYSNGICPKCKTSKYEAIKNNDLNYYTQSIGVVGQRSGKSAGVALLAAAVLMYYLIKYKKPSSHYNVIDDWVLYGTFVGLRYSDAYEQLWVHFHNFITKRPWFKNYNSFLDQKGKELGKPLYKIKDGFASYTFKGLVFYPSGPDGRMLRGRTRIFYSIDEVCWFTGDKSSIKFDPDKIYAALDNSLLTINVSAKELLKKYPDTIPAFGCNISSPRTRTDMGMRLLKQSKNSKTLYGYHSPTWEYHPKISIEDLADKFATKPEDTKRDFGAEPPFGSSPYIGSPGSIVNIFRKKDNCIKIQNMVKVKGSLNEIYTYPRISINKTHTHPSVLAVDCGYSNNSFALSLMHTEGDTVIVSALLEIIPELNALHFPKIYKKIIIPILEEFNVQLVVFDRWESINISQNIYEDLGIDALRYSVTLNDFMDLKADILSNKVLLPNCEINVDNLISLESSVNDLVFNRPVAHLFLQLISSVNNGKTITKGDDMTDDLLRALVLGYAFLIDEDYEYLFIGSGSETTNSIQSMNEMICVVEKSNNAMFNNSSIGCIIRK